MAISVVAELTSASAPRFTMQPEDWPVDHEADPMRTGYLVLILFGIGIVGAMPTLREATSQVPPTTTADGLRPVTSFASIADRRSRSIALFEEAGKVLQH